MKKIKIAIISHGVSNKGGQDRYLKELAIRLARENEVHIFATEIENIDENDNIHKHIIKVIKRPFLFKSIHFYIKTIFLNLDDFDIIHTVGGASAKHNVITFQFCNYGWKKSLNNLKKKLIPFLNYYYQNLYSIINGYLEKKAILSSKNKAIIAVSNHTAKEISDFYNVPIENIKVIYNGVDTEEFNPENKNKYRSETRRKLNIKDDNIVLLFIGDFARKGLFTVISALAQIKRKDIILLAVGDKNKKPYINQAKKLNVEKQVIFTGFSSDVKKLYSASDIFVFPTLYEPFGMVITEAMASGLPVITSKIAGAGELIKDNINGFLIENSDDVDELSNKILYLLNNKEKWDDVGVFARESVMQYNWEYVYNETIKIYQTIINDK